MIFGALLLLGAAGLTWWNQKENREASEFAAQIVPQLVSQIQSLTAEEQQTSSETTADTTESGVFETVEPQEPAAAETDIEVIPDLQKPVELLTEEDKKMTEVEIEGNPYIGYLSIPNLNMELPVISTWDLNRLKIAPCRYSGSIRGEDLVIMAHNYVSHFGSISKLNIGDSISFTDMNGKVTCYEVVGKDVLDPSAVEVVTAGEYDLTLFTCTYGGASRITVYCDVVDN